ncbi:S-adenosyl-L-methionine-dependent methyltransferase [Daldinia caldariorum]|uniref:S-adenosyl-L-methionine-dependent methyltransferase n=1 Tax=Daldinia caldariorum TaxID=326644 RepID=UPI002008CF9C|nr:S-adenosyl-L-methionine-dependent methyltransferase [Daldinia caldariorum]KAI1472596.1 S-adenosyl-L-methionine-dependent methyltransferase [Daldinia caldariorum]
MADSWRPTSARSSGSSTSKPPEQAELIAEPDSDEEYQNDDDRDRDSALGSDIESSAGSIASSILEYRMIQGRTYHSDRHNTNYFTPNDEQQLQSIDITHHYLTLLLEDRLFLAPISDNVQNVLDIGTGSGIWSIDFADQFPHAQVIGTDLSPMQPLWVPPNVRFELEDCTQPWSWPESYFDFVHLRYLFGAIPDWDELLRQAYRVTRPGGWVQSCETECIIKCDDGSVPPDSAMVTFWNKIYSEIGAKLGTSFEPITYDLQENAFRAAGFKNIEVYDYKLPITGWPTDKRMSEVGQYVQLTLLNDLEGYTLMPWHMVMNEDAPGYKENLSRMRRELHNKRIHAYMRTRYVYGQKPEV